MALTELGMYAVFKTIFKHKTGDYKTPRRKQRGKLLDIDLGNSYQFFLFSFFFCTLHLRTSKKTTIGTIPN